MRILIVEDEPRLANALHETLSFHGHTVDTAGDGREGEALLHSYPYDLAVLDIVLPDRNGLELCREARRRGLRLPILMLTARDTLADKVAGLDAGADDYLVKPFEMAELLARVRALLRRADGPKDGVLAVADLSYDPATGEASRAGVPVHLARKEKALLELLLRQAGRVVRREQIEAQLWDREGPPDSDVVRAHVKGLRKAIGDTASPRLIQTVHGIGYRLVDNVSQA